MPLELARYTELKANGSVSLAKIGAAYAWSVRRFDGSTGIEKSSEVGAIDLRELLKQRDAQVALLAQYDAVISDLKALG